MTRDTTPFIQRLVKEWRKHESIIIAVDFDDTIYPWKMDGNYMERLALLRRAQALGAHIVINTAREKRRHQFTVDYCAEHGVTVASVNTNPFPLPYGNDGKVYANIFIDDRGGLFESLDILETACYIMEGKPTFPKEG